MAAILSRPQFVKWQKYQHSRTKANALNTQMGSGGNDLLTMPKSGKTPVRIIL